MPCSFDTPLISHSMSTQGFIQNFRLGGGGDYLCTVKCGIRGIPRIFFLRFGLTIHYFRLLGGGGEFNNPPLYETPFTYQNTKCMNFDLERMNTMYGDSMGIQQTGNQNRESKQGIKTGNQNRESKQGIKTVNQNRDGQISIVIIHE